MCSAVKNFFLDRRNQFIFAVTFAWGILAHGMVIFNIMAVHDGLGGLFGSGGWFGLYLGRWLQPILVNLDRILIGSGSNITAPLFYGFITFFSLSVLICIFAGLFMLKDKIILTALSGFAAAGTTTLMLFGYIDFVPHYFVGVFITVAGSLILCIWPHSVRNFLAGTILLCLGIAEYQCFLPVGLSIMLLYLINKTERENLSWAEYWKTAFYFLLSGIVAIILYLLGTELVLLAIKLFARLVKHKAANIHISDYAGLSTMGITTLSGYISRIIDAYKYFIVMPRSMASVFVAGSRNLYYIMLIISVYLAGKKFLCLRKSSQSSSYQFLIAVIIFPLCVNLLYVMTDKSSVHALHMLTWIPAVIFMLQRADELPEFRNKKFFRNAVIILLMLSNFIMARHDNACYVKLKVCQTQAISYFTTLITRIKSTEGYNDEFPVAYINGYDKQDMSIPYIRALDKLTPIYPYSIADLLSTPENTASVKAYATNHGYLINNYAWITFMKLWCAYDPKHFDAEGGGA